MVTSSHVTKMAVIPLVLPYPKTPRCMQTLWLCFIEPALPIEILHFGKMNFRPFLILWPWYWSDDFHIRTWPGDALNVQVWTAYIKAIVWQTDRQACRQSRPKLHTTSLWWWSINKYLKKYRKRTGGEIRVYHLISLTDTLATQHKIAVIFPISLN